MRHFNNEVLRALEYEEHIAVLEASQLLAKAFKRKVFQCKITPSSRDKEVVWGIAFAFDMADF